MEFKTPLQSSISTSRLPTPRPGSSASPAPNRVTREQILPLLPNPLQLRNICILAHVDHGKTTLTDSLVASNGIISHRLAGKLRYLDSRDDEQQRGITMESSAITLLWKTTSLGEKKWWGVNLIDSPGHVDFSGQVTTATRLCDGAVVIVDVIEGICTQTLAVLRQAKQEHLSAILIFNKIDRLRTELKMTPSEATVHLHALMDQMNRVVAESFESRWNFDPSLGNVLFSSATDGWCFGVKEMSNFYSTSKQMQISTDQWWGESFSWDSKQKIPVARTSNRLSLFTQLILDPIFRVYDLDLADADAISKITAILGISLVMREIKEPKQLYRSIMSSWCPLADCVFNAVIDHIPDPINCLPSRLNLIYQEQQNLIDNPKNRKLIEKIGRNDSDAPLLVYVSKIFPVFLPNEEHAKLVGMSRCFSGILKVGDKVQVLLPKHSGEANDPVEDYQIEELFLLMGRDLEPVDTIYPGNVFGIGGSLHKLIYKSATLSTTCALPAVDFGIPREIPLVQVAVQPANLQDFDKIASGLSTLCQADPCAETFIRPESGEYVLAVAGELHLEQCLKDLKERFAKVDIIVSPPIVKFRETVLGEASMLLESGIVISIERSQIEENELYCDNRDFFTMYQSAFTVAMKAGPLCQEPIMNVKVSVTHPDLFSLDSNTSSFSMLSQIKSAIHTVFLSAWPRLALAMYACDIQCSNDTLGRVYSILNKRSAHILGEEWNESSSSFLVKSKLPVIESWGLSEEMRGKTSGMAFPQLIYCGFEVLDQPCIKEEDDEDSELISNEGNEVEEVETSAMKYLKQVRLRKGLYVEREIVHSGEKQRTLKR
jgi:small GTP-binding protein